mmetsp:Transcript_9241/g.22262  ORF Transcript_9241/g.22262 Transcript_9241/m.22262 type:complete len:524 (-) Transcript_9241:274-1845(-)
MRGRFGDEDATKAASEFLERVGGHLLDGRLPVKALDTCVSVAAELFPYIPQSARSELISAGLLSSLVTAKEEEQRMLAASLASLLAGRAGSAECVGQLLQAHSQLLRDEDPDVRKDAVAGFPALADALPESDRERLILEPFLTACSDDVWNVRMESASVLPRLAKSISGASAMESLSNAFIRLLGDVSKWVRHESRLQLEEFARSPAAPSPPTALLQHASLMMSGCGGGEMDVKEAVAAIRALPVIAEKMDAAWCEAFAEDLQRICDNGKVDSRKALAETLHLLAPMNSGRCEAKLRELFLRLLADDREEVRSGLLAGIGKLARHLPPDCREAMVERLGEAGLQQSENCSGWRTRLLVLEELPEVGGTEGCALRVAELALKMCCDPVAEIRLCASKQVSRILSGMWRRRSAGDAAAGAARSVVDDLKALAAEPNHQSRQAYANAVAALPQEAEDSLLAELTPPLAALAEDRISGVRVTVAQALAAKAKDGRLSADGTVALHKMAHDVDAEVRRIVASVGSSAR